MKKGSSNLIKGREDGEKERLCSLCEEKREKTNIIRGKVRLYDVDFLWLQVVLAFVHIGRLSEVVTIFNLFCTKRTQTRCRRYRCCVEC